MRSVFKRLVAGILLCGILPAAASAATAFGPTAYLQAGDTPTDFFSDDCDHYLEDFEDNSIDPFLTIDNGAILPPFAMSGAPSSVTDSVDGDDGTVDGSGNAGYSWFTGALGAVDRSLTITFGSTVTSAGLVFTDGDAASTSITLEAFDMGGNSIGFLDAGDLADDVYTGETAEDRFLGFHDLAGIGSLTLTMNAGSGIEIDHIQWQDCQVVPEPATLGMLSFAVLGCLGLRRRR